MKIPYRICRATVIALCLSSVLSGQTPRVALQTVLSGLNGQPVFLTNAKDGTNRRFIVEQVGRIRVLQPGASSPTVFLDISSRIRFGGEQGLLGLAFHPQFATNRRFYVDYVRQSDGMTVIAEYQVSTGNPNVANTTENILLTIAQPFENHKGGMIEFGPDGFLYIGMGDGGSGNDPGNRAQNTGELLGKILRIDVDHPGTPPPTNPFVNNPGRDEIYAYGFRNPWRFSFDRLTGQLYVADVGQDAREEIDIVTNGGNYGWRVFEGTRCTNLGPASCSTPGFIPPIAEYTNTGSAGRCSITGGYVYRGTQASLPYGGYIYGDFCSGEILMLKDGVQTVLIDTTLQISSFGEDEAGEIYVVSLTGSISRLTNPDAVTGATRSFSMPDRGASVASTVGSASGLTVGYARIQANALPAGIAIMGLQQRGVLVSETSVSASPLITSGRLFAEVAGPVNTGVAIANPNTSDVTLSFYFTDSNGTDSAVRTTRIPAGQQIAAFLNEEPFNGANSIFGTFTFSSNLAVAAVAIRGFTNERSEFLMTTLPVLAPGGTSGETLTIPEFADGGGWRTQVVLVNPSDASIGGTIQFLGTDGQTINASGYSIAARSATRIQTAGTPASTQVGSVRISATTTTPSAIAIFSFKPGDATVTEAGIPALRNGTAFQVYAEKSGAVETGLALANPSSNPLVVGLSLTRTDGSPTGLTGQLNIPANGQISTFLTQIPGFTSLTVPFQGVLRITSAAPVAAASLRGHTNQRREFLVTATTPADESAATTSPELFFPHLADGAGYNIQFVFFGRASAGTMYLVGRSGQPVSLLFQ
jgi:glucose/arabinose dehydrogenase